ncbi:MAG: type transport system permease protein [Micromonosporaceae bacterium]|nr:type transport system permease protein [Micromonosporaceae bacterium]
MIRLIRAEFVKLRTTQVWFWLLLSAVAVTTLLLVAQLAPHDGVNNENDVYNVFTASGTAYVVVFVLGVLGITTEYRYQTITPTVLTTPSRWALVTAKMIAYALLGAIYALICVIVQLAVALPWLSSKHISVSLTENHIPAALLGVFLVVALFGIVGLGIGALLRNQIVAVSVGVIFLLVIQNVIVAIPGVKYAFPYLPGGAVASIFTVVGSRDVNGATLLSPAGGVVVLLVWAFVPAILGAMFTLNRDIT